MKFNNSIIITSIGLLALIFLIYRNTQKDLNQKTYLITTYMYVFASFLIIILTNQIDIFNSKEAYYIAFAMSLISLVLMTRTPKEDQFRKHLYWVILIISSGFMLKPTVKTIVESGSIIKTIIIVSSIFLIVSYFAYTYKTEFIQKWKPFLITSLVILVGSELLNNSHEKIFDNNSGLINTVFCGIFIILLFIDTKNVIKMSENLENNCKGGNHLICADYPSASTSMILDTTNILIDSSSIITKITNVSNST